MAPAASADKFTLPNIPAEATSVWTEIQALLSEFSTLTGHTVDWVKAAEILGPPVLAAFATGGPTAALGAFWTTLMANWQVIFPSATPAVISGQLALYSAGHKIGADLV